MTVSSTDRKQQFNADGSTVNFPFTFKYTDDDEIKVTARNTTSSTLDGIAANSESELALTTDYTVSPTTGGSSGTMTTVATWSTGIRLTVYRQSTRDQQTDYVENDDFPAETHEAALDHGILVSQEIGEEVARAPKFPITDESSAVGDFPNSDTRASKFLGFDANGKPIASDGTDSSVPISAFGATLVDDADAATARETLGITTIEGLFDVTAGTGNAYTITVDSTVTAYSDGLIVFFEPDRDNTGAATLNANSIGAKTLKLTSGADVAAGDVKTGVRYVAIFDSTDDVWRILGASGKNIRSIEDASAANGNILVGDGTDFVAESGATARASLGAEGNLVAVRVYTANDTWSKPSELSFVEVEVVGAGGGSGGSAATGAGQTAAGAGGGGGGYARKKIAAGSLGATETVTIGAGGTAGSAGGNGGNGGTSSFGTHATATGGNGGTAGEASSAAFNPAGAGGAGGVGSSGDLNVQGDGGTSGLGSASKNESIAGSGGGSALGGARSGIRTGGASAGQAGYPYGGGATGGVAAQSQSAQTGAAGSDGVVIVREYK